MPLRVRVVYDPRDAASARRASGLERHAPKDVDVVAVAVDERSTSVPDPAHLGADLVVHWPGHGRTRHARDGLLVARFVHWRAGASSHAADAERDECQVLGRQRPAWRADAAPVTFQVPDLDPAVMSDDRAGLAHASWFERLRFLVARQPSVGDAASMAATVVIPLRRQRDEWLDACVASALAQGEGVEVVVATAPDTPSSNLARLAARAAQESRLRILERAPDSGFPGAINTGIRAARGERLALLLSDDWLAEGAIARCLEVEADIVCAGHAVHDADASTTFWIRRPERARFDVLASMEERAAYLSHLFVFRRDVLCAVGGVDPAVGLTGADDFDLPWCLLERGASVALVPDALYHYRDHAAERLTLRDPALQARDLAAIFDKHGIAGPERDERLARHLAWAGEPCHVVAARVRPESS